MVSPSVRAFARPRSAWIAPLPIAVTPSRVTTVAAGGYRRGRGPPALFRHVALLWLIPPWPRPWVSSPLRTPPTPLFTSVLRRGWSLRRLTVTRARAEASPPPPPPPPPPAPPPPPPPPPPAPPPSASGVSRFPMRPPSPPPSGVAADAVTAVLRDLNAEQVAAVTAPTAAPILVLAGPGSGKTRVLTARAAYLAAAARIPLSSMLAVTFTKKAAAEMGMRLERLLAPQGGDPRSGGGVQDWGKFGGDGDGVDGHGGDGDGSGNSSRQHTLQGATVATLHSIACRWLRQYGSAIGVPSTFAVLAADESRRLVAAVVKDAGLDPQVVRPHVVAAVISYAKSVSRLGNGGLDAWLDAISNEIPQGRALATAYLARCREAEALDFDDILLSARWLLWVTPDVRAVLQARYRHLLVDECQDLNIVQYDILRLLASPAMQVARGGGDGDGGGDGALCTPPSAFFVGDFDQLLYSWRGARPEHGTTFATDFGTHAVPMARYELSANYRSTGIITAVGSALIVRNPGRGVRAPMRSMRGASPATPRVVVVPVSDARAEAAYVVSRSRALVRSGMVPSYASIAVMYRSNMASRALEEALVASGDVPFSLTGGVRFYDRREVRDLCAYLRLVSSSADGVAFSRVVNVPPRRIGDKTLADLDAYAATAGEGGTAVGSLHAVRLLVAATEAGEAVPLRKAAVAQLGAFVAVIDSLAAAAAAGATVIDLLDHTLKAVGYREYLDTTSFSGVKGLPIEESRQQRWANVLELRSVACQATSLVDFLDDVALMASDGTGDTETAYGKSGGAVAPRLSLMTLHASKGLEFEAVFLVGLEEGSLPTYPAMVAEHNGQPESLEEERRLAYVGVTRARTHLYMCFKRFRMVIARDGGRVGSAIGADEDVFKREGHSGGSRMVMLRAEPSRFLADLAPALVEVVDAASGKTLREDAGTVNSGGRRAWEVDPADEGLSRGTHFGDPRGWSSARNRSRQSSAAATGAAMARRVATRRLPADPAHVARASRRQPPSSSTQRRAAGSGRGGGGRSGRGGGSPRPALAWAEGTFVRCPVRERGLIMRVDAATGEIDVFWMQSGLTETLGVGERNGLTLTR